MSCRVSELLGEWPPHDTDSDRSSYTLFNASALWYLYTEVDTGDSAVHDFTVGSGRAGP